MSPSLPYPARGVRAAQAAVTRTACHSGEDDGVVAAADHAVLAVPLHRAGQHRPFHVRAAALEIGDGIGVGHPDHVLTSFVVPGPRAAGTDAVRAFLAAHPAVTAVAAFDDDAAIRTLTALQDLGLSAPGDLAVIGFDDIEYGALTTPALTTVHVDAEAHGRQAARAVLGLEPGDLAHPPGYVIVRDSA